MPTVTQIALSEQDLDELRQALAVYREDLIRMARRMEDARYLNSLPWVKAFELRLLELRA